MGAAAAPKSSAGKGTVIAGIGFAACAYFLFSLQDTTIKWLVAGYPTTEIMFVRGLVVGSLCFVFGRPGLLVRAIRSPIRGQLIWRSGVLIGAWLLYYSAARYLQLAELITIYFSSPLVVTVLAIPLLGERVSTTRWISVLIGFTGVLIACHPNTLLSADLSTIGPIAMVFTASALWAYTTILIRQIVHAESTDVLMLVSNVLFIVVCGTAMLFYWVTPSLTDGVLMALAALFGASGQFMSTEGIRRAPASVTAPLSFSSLLWAFTFGYLVFGDVPDLSVFIGAGFILASGLLITASEWRLSRLARQKTAAGPVNP